MARAPLTLSPGIDRDDLAASKVYATPTGAAMAIFRSNTTTGDTTRQRID